MKSLRIFMITFICFSVVSCVDGQFYKTVKGNGKVTEKERQASYFNGVRVSSGIDVYLSQGSTESITVEADENLHEYIVTEIKNNILNVYTDNVNIRDAEAKRVHVTLKDLNSLQTSSAGDIAGKTALKGDRVKIGASSAGDITIELSARDVLVNISSSGNIRLSGEADFLEADLSSAGDLEAFNFKVREADVNASSAGDARIYVTEKLTARASSAGDISYTGKPQQIDAHSSSAGSIRAR